MNAESPGVYDDEPRPGPQSCRLDGHRGYHGGFCRIHQLTCAAPACRRLANPRITGRQCRLGRHYRGAGRMTWAPSLPSQKLGSYVHSKLAALPFQDLGTGRLKAPVIASFSWCRGLVWSSPRRVQGPLYAPPASRTQPPHHRNPPTSVARSNTPTNAGKPTSPTGAWPIAPTPSSCAGSATTPATRSRSRATSTIVHAVSSTKPLNNTASHTPH